ncbi:MAG: hypothetical protein ACKN9T_13570 [Candidatus Methylumidiphilus sp.]
MIKVISIEFSDWMVEGAQGVEELGMFAHHEEAVSAIWMHLVQTRRHHAYLLFKRQPLLLRWQPNHTVFWGTVQGGVPRMYQEPMDSSAAKRTFKLYKA